MSALSKETLKTYARTSREQFESLLKEFVELPTVSVDPTKGHTIREAAKVACATIRQFGGEPEVLETGGQPIVHGRWGNDPSRPTLTIYNHLDVQPASRE